MSVAEANKQLVERMQCNKQRNCEIHAHNFSLFRAFARVHVARLHVISLRMESLMKFLFAVARKACAAASVASLAKCSTILATETVCTIYLSLAIDSRCIHCLAQIHGARTKRLLRARRQQPFAQHPPEIASTKYQSINMPYLFLSCDR